MGETGMELSTGLGGEEMNSLDRYLGQVSRHLMGLSKKLRQDVLMELRSHIVSRTEVEGGDIDAVIEKMVNPRETARSYVQLYGYGLGIKVLASVVAAVMAFLTLPFSLGSPAMLGTVWMSNASLILLILFLIGVGVKLGPRAAIAVGATASAARFLALGVAFALSLPGLVTEPVAILAFALTTVAVALVGYLAAPRQGASTE